MTTYLSLLAHNNINFEINAILQNHARIDAKMINLNGHGKLVILINRVLKINSADVGYQKRTNKQIKKTKNALLLQLVVINAQLNNANGPGLQLDAFVKLKKTNNKIF